MEFQAFCPCDCGEIVLARDEGFNATVITTGACPTMQTMNMVSATWRKSAVHTVPVEQFRHRDGLVIIG